MIVSRVSLVPLAANLVPLGANLAATWAENGSQVGCKWASKSTWAPKPKKCVSYWQGTHVVALGHCMLGEIWEHCGIKWASDGALMGPWTLMDTKMRPKVDKIANLGAIWSQLGTFWAQLGLQVWNPGEALGGAVPHVWGS